MSEAAGRVKIILTADAATYSAAFEAAQRQASAFGKAVGGASQTTRKEMQEARASVALLGEEVGIHLPRHLRTFVAGLPGVAPLMAAAFSGVAVFGLVEVVGRAGAAIVEFVKKAREVPDAISRGFRELNASAVLTNDELKKTNDELENQIAKLQGRHQNTLVVEIDEARIAADKLAASLEADNQKVSTLLEKNKVGFGGGLVSQQYQTKGTAGSVNYWDRRLSDQGYDYRNAVRQNGAGSDQAKAAKQTLDAIRAAALQWVASRTAEVKSWPSQSGQTANLNILSGYRETLTSQQDSEDLNGQNEADSQKLKHLQAGRSASEEERKQQEQIVKNLEAHLEAQKAVHSMTLADEADFWEHYMAFAKVGSLSYITAQNDANRAIASLRAETAREQEKWDHEAGQPMKPDDLSKDSDYSRGIQEQSKAISDWLKNLNEAPLIQQKNAQALAEQSLQYAESTGQISKLDAAQVRAQMHAQEYTEQVLRLQNAMAGVGALRDAGSLSPADANQQLSGLQIQMTTLGGSRDLQARQDQAAIDAAGAMDQVRLACAQLAMKFMDTGAGLANLTTSTIDGMNQSLASALMAHATSGQEYRRGIKNAAGGQLRSGASSGLKMGMDSVEGPLLSKLGLKKPDGTSTNPMWVRIAGAAASGSSLSGMAGLLQKTNGDTGVLHTVMPELTALIPGFASGGDTPSNMPFVVGEDGPEVMSMPHSAHVTPNGRSSVGSGLNMPISIDARGSNDPAAIEAAAYRAIHTALPHITSTAMAAMSDNQRRGPLSRRG